MICRDPDQRARGFHFMPVPPLVYITSHVTCVVTSVLRLAGTRPSPTDLSLPALALSLPETPARLRKNPEKPVLLGGSEKQTDWH